MATEKGTYEHCPHCEERPAAGFHACPLNLEVEGCTCCGRCAKLCSDIRGHIMAHTPAVFIDYGTGEVQVDYLVSALEGDEDQEPGDGDLGLTA